MTKPDPNHLSEKMPPIRLKRFQEVKSKYVGAEGTPERDAYEAELRAELITEKIKEQRTGASL